LRKTNLIQSRLSRLTYYPGYKIKITKKNRTSNEYKGLIVGVSYCRKFGG
jgi:hypothetical protein